MEKVKYMCECGCTNKNCDCEIVHHDMVEKAKKELSDAVTLHKMAVFFKAFADATRIKIIDVLKNYELCVCDISVLLNMTKSAISHQLKYLRKLNIVKYRKEGKVVYYSLADRHVTEIYNICLEHVLEEKNA